jgi:hypothetical protein
MEVMHFKSQKERLDYLKGNFEEIQPTEVEVEVKVEAEEEPKEEPKKAKKKGKKKDDTVQA